MLIVIFSAFESQDSLRLAQSDSRLLVGCLRRSSISCADPFPPNLIRLNCCGVNRTFDGYRLSRAACNLLFYLHLKEKGKK
ncbi:hypothetical protein, partial [Roseibium sp. RKSG952]|uniref:hypothetical protein n=1 Tax=Roseibium sp. RKSG952 TaxID=2529384 RepID=UPI001AD8FE3F